MLHLHLATEKGWAAWALDHPETLLLDHAHCELKAASTALSLSFRYSDHPFLHPLLSSFAREELSHFELVLAEMRRRGYEFRHLTPSTYAGDLRKAVRYSEPDRFVDTLLCCALIEARSCERFQLLAEEARDPGLRKLYGGLLASEARHHRMFVDAVERLAPKAAVETRLRELAVHESEVLARTPREPRLHHGGIAVVVEPA